MQTLFISTKVRLVYMFDCSTDVKPRKAEVIYPNEVFLLMSVRKQENNQGVFSMELFHQKHGWCTTFSDSQTSLSWAKLV
jgi:hypothetical protein